MGSLGGSYELERSDAAGIPRGVNDIDLAGFPLAREVPAGAMDALGSGKTEVVLWTERGDDRLLLQVHDEDRTGLGLVVIMQAGRQHVVTPDVDVTYGAAGGKAIDGLEDLLL